MGLEEGSAGLRQIWISVGKLAGLGGISHFWYLPINIAAVYRNSEMFYSCLQAWTSCDGSCRCPWPS